MADEDAFEDVCLQSAEDCLIVNDQQPEHQCCGTFQVSVSMNGLRRNLSNDVEQLKETIEAVINSGQIYKEDLKEDLVDKLNAVIQDSNILNCVFYESIPEFSDLSKLTVEPIDPDDEFDEDTD